MTLEEQRQVRKIILHSRIGCIVVKMSELFRISLTDALEIELLGKDGNRELRDILFRSFNHDEQQ